MSYKCGRCGGKSMFGQDAAPCPEGGSHHMTCDWRCTGCGRFPGSHAASCGREDTLNPKASQGAKKVPLDLVPPSALHHLATAFADGARKYGPFNWRTSKVSTSTYIGALLRHAAAFQDGEDLAEDSGAHHLGHLMACCAIILDAQECGTLVDDRPKSGPAARLQRSWVAQQLPPIMIVGATEPPQWSEEESAAIAARGPGEVVKTMGIEAIPENATAADFGVIGIAGPSDAQLREDIDRYMFREPWTPETYKRFAVDWGGPEATKASETWRNTLTLEIADYQARTSTWLEGAGFAIKRPPPKVWHGPLADPPPESPDGGPYAILGKLLGCVRFAKPIRLDQFDGIELVITLGPDRPDYEPEPE